jgi:large subunit ribosomal protein L31
MEAAKRLASGRIPAPHCLIVDYATITEVIAYCNGFNSQLDRTTTEVYTLALTMKKDLHPTNYRPVVFQDINSGTSFLTRSTAASDENVKWEDGNEYPLVKVHISSASHPFFTGQEKLVDVEGRVDKFKARTEAAAKKREEAAKRGPKTRAKKTADEVEPQKLGK